MKLTFPGKVLACILTVIMMQLFFFLSSGFVNPILLVLTLIPLVVIVLTVILQILVKNRWMVTLAFALSLILGMFLFFNTSFFIWVAFYTLLSLATTVVMGFFSRKS